MTFHQSDDFTDAVESVAAHFKMRSIFIEKDYWVTYVLKNLSTSKIMDDVVFKGGTSLSKAYECINRFSEDIDLAILKIAGMSGNQITARIKEVENIVNQGLIYFQHVTEEKKGRNRRTFYHYPKALKDNNFSQIKDHIQLEINAFTQPVPYEKKQVQSYIAQFLVVNGFQEMINQFGLEPFSVNVLARERTVFEKLLSLIRLSYEGPEKVRSKIRHFYDIHQLMHQHDLQEKVLTEENFKILTLAIEDDASNGIFAGAWIQKPFSESPLLKDFEGTWRTLETTYISELGELVWSELPSPSAIVKTFNEIKKYLITFDRYCDRL
jgi:predicted nucleotidyltransferase component of viral defense system